MYGIPDEIDWSFLLGAKVEQIAIGEHDLQIHLFKNISISSNGAFDHLAAEKMLSNSSEIPMRSTTLVSLLGTKIEKVAVEDHHVLILWFSNHEMVKVYDNDRHYESFTVTYPGHTIVV